MDQWINGYIIVLWQSTGRATEQDGNSGPKVDSRDSSFYSQLSLEAAAARNVSSYSCMVLKMSVRGLAKGVCPKRLFSAIRILASWSWTRRNYVWFSMAGTHRFLNDLQLRARDIEGRQTRRIRQSPSTPRAVAGVTESAPTANRWHSWAGGASYRNCLGRIVARQAFGQLVGAGREIHETLNAGLRGSRGSRGHGQD